MKRIVTFLLDEQYTLNIHKMQHTYYNWILFREWSIGKDRIGIFWFEIHRFIIIMYVEEKLVFYLASVSGST